LTLFTDPAIPAEVMGDALRLRQVLVNLANNAIKFSSGGERPGKVSLRTRLVEQGMRRVAVEFQLADNGIGMDEQTQARLFTAFTQADASTTRRFGGTGLGLAISSQLLQLMGGEIVLRSAPGRGSTFIVRLPFQPLAAKSEAAGVAAEVAGLACRVVGGPEGLADDLAAYLAHGGAAVERAPDLASAREQGCPTGLSLWIVDAGDESPTADQLHLAAGVRSDQDVRFVVIGRGHRRKPRALVPDLVEVDGNVLDRQTFLRAVAIAAGREQPEAAAGATSGRTEAAVSPPSHHQARQQGRLILVAEDNETNQKVILRQLGLLGYAADVAGDGREALKHFQSGNYALLLTDLHMPEMDGYELSLAIRSGEDGKRRIPIIALTANALKGEAKRCRIVGMDDYLSKPVPLEKLKAVLNKWLPAAAATDSVAVSPAPTLAALDVKILAALVGDEPKVICDFLEDFRASATRIAAELGAACQRGQTAAAGAAAHKLKSAARAVGALKLGDLCAEMERAGQAGDKESLAALLAGFETELIAVKACLDLLLAERDQASNAQR
ncbi:MAG: ATP-binding protein, partial [Rhodocyclales bacterium]|nr:ATP-binding protein [Rhodocyclales bacterium]